MLAVVLALCLAADDADLPRSLSLEPRAGEPSIWVGGHLGIAGAYDADNPAFVLGGNGRARLLPWLGVDVSVDFQTKQDIDKANADIWQLPIEAAALFYPPLDLPVHPYGIAGTGFTITSIDPPGRSSRTDVNLLFFLGFGAEFELAPDLLLDANVRFVFAQDPPNSGSFSADWAQFTVGLMFKLSR